MGGRDRRGGGRRAGGRRGELRNVAGDQHLVDDVQGAVGGAHVGLDDGRAIDQQGLARAVELDFGAFDRLNAALGALDLGRVHRGVDHVIGQQLLQDRRVVGLHQLVELARRQGVERRVGRGEQRQVRIALQDGGQIGRIERLQQNGELARGLGGGDQIAGGHNGRTGGNGRSGGRSSLSSLH